MISHYSVAPQHTAHAVQERRLGAFTCGKTSSAAAPDRHGMGRLLRWRPQHSTPASGGDHGPKEAMRTA